MRDEKVVECVKARRQRWQSIRDRCESEFKVRAVLETSIDIKQ